MQNYITHIEYANLLPKRDYLTVGQNIIIKLTDKEFINAASLFPIQKEIVLAVKKNEAQLLSLGGNYQKIISNWRKVKLQGYNGNGVTVGTIDTGNDMYFDHYSNTTDEFYNFSNSPNADALGNKHGTQVSSIIKSPQIGMANGCRFISSKIFDDNGAVTETSVLQAINQMVLSGVDFFGMSFSFSPTTNISNALLNASNLGHIPFASCGNSLTDSTTIFPANAEGVIAVNSVNKDNKAVHRSWQAGAGHGVDISCNGVGSEVVYNNGVINAGGGTSFSTPFAVAVAACEKERLGLMQKSDNKKIINYILNKAIKHEDPAVRRVITF
jgi:hypothetical protein